ncbi:MAG: cysteine desulfurase family protein [Microbacterium sp.]
MIQEAMYLDNAATTPIRPQVLEAMAPYLTREFGNPSSVHGIGKRASDALEDARGRVARVLGFRTGDVIFTSGGTEANNLAVKGVALAALEHRGARHVVTTPIEHESVLESADYLRRFHGFEVTQVPVDGTGLVDLDEVARAIRPDTAVVSIGMANNEIGTVQDAAALREAAGRAPLHLDAVQAAGWLPLGDTGADALSLAGHKVGAPKGTGVLAVRGRIPLEPLLHGGGQQRGRRSGTEPVADAVGIATALELAERDREQTAARITAIRDRFIAEVLALAPSARLTGHPTQRLPGSASFTFEGTSGERILLDLERQGIVCSSGSACAAGSDEPSHVLLACGIEPEIAQTAVRFTLAHAHTEDLSPVAHALAAAVQ